MLSRAAADTLKTSDSTSFRDEEFELSALSVSSASTAPNAPRPRDASDTVAVALHSPDDVAKIATTTPAGIATTIAVQRILLKTR